MRHLNFQIIKTDMITISGIEQNMIANNLTPFNPTHPGELLLEELECRNISQAKFSEKIGVKPSLLNEIIKGKRGINTEMALLLEAALGISAKFWINLQNDYNLQKARSNESFMSRLAEIRKIAAVL